jgi:hypothetical protein
LQPRETLLAISAVQVGFGGLGMLASGIVLGFAWKITPATLAASALVSGMLSNTLLKLGIAIVLGGPGFRLAAGFGLTAVALALGAVPAVPLLVPG